MFKRNDGIGVNAIQNRFTAMLNFALHNQKITYMNAYNKRKDKELSIEDYDYIVGEEYNFIQAILDYDIIKTILKKLTDKERKIIVLHILKDKDFAEIGKEIGLTYHGTATAFHRALKKLRKSFLEATI